MTSMQPSERCTKGAEIFSVLRQLGQQVRGGAEGQEGQEPDSEERAVEPLPDFAPPRFLSWYRAGRPLRGDVSCVALLLLAETSSGCQPSRSCPNRTSPPPSTSLRDAAAQNLGPTRR
eukprot:767368-Hanusia_phi.AAC.2